MSIDPNLIYDSFSFRLGDVHWTIPGPLSGDLVAGLLIGLDVCIEANMVKYWEHEYYFEYEVQIFGHDNPIPLVLHNLDKEFTYYEIPWHDEKPSPRPGEFGWEIVFPVADHSRLFSFRSPKFIQGFISMCNAFEVDFRNYVINLPYTHDPITEETTYYRIQGYDIPMR